MIIRSPDDICLLCEQNKSTKTGSHIIPAFMCTAPFGKRDKEDMFSVTTSTDKPIGEFFGRSNLESNSDEVKQNPLVYDFIFCDECENKFGNIENLIAKELIGKIRIPNYKLNFPIDTLRDNSKLILCNKIKPNDFNLFFYGLIWRLNLHYRLIHGKDFVDPQLIEKLRSHLNRYMGFELDKIASLNIDSLDLYYIILNCFDQNDPTFNITSLIPDFSNPYWFFIGEYAILFSPNINKLLSMKEYYGIYLNFIDKQINHLSNTGKISIISNTFWIMILNKTLERMVEITVDKFASKLIPVMYLDINSIKQILYNRAQDIQLKEPQKGFTFCVQDAYFEILNLNKLG